MSKALKFLILFISIMTFFFFIAAFIEWQINPKYWGSIRRTVLGIFGSMVAGMASGMITDLSDNK